MTYNSTEFGQLCSKTDETQKIRPNVPFYLQNKFQIAKILNQPDYKNSYLIITLFGKHRFRRYINLSTITYESPLISSLGSVQTTWAQFWAILTPSPYLDTY